MKTKTTLLAAAALTISVTTAGCAIVATKTEYANYRAVRLAKDDDQRYAAMATYMSAHPNGFWASEFQNEREQREPQFWDANRNSADGLRAYLALFPDGPHAAEARPRLAALEQVQGNRANEQQQTTQVQRAQQTDRAERQRTWATRALTYWTRTLSSIRNWGTPIADVARANPDFSRAFGTEPRPVCSRTECVKHYYAGFAIPVPGATRIDRQFEMLLRLRMEDSKVERAEILMPARGFSRWYEMENRVPVTDEDPAQREQVFAWVLERVNPLISAAFPGAAPIQDYVSEPIDAPTVNLARTGASSTGEAAPAAPAAAEPAAPAPAAPAVAATTPAPAAAPAVPAADEELNRLIEGAAGPVEAPAPAEPVAEEPVAGETFILPVPLKTWQVGTIRAVVFSASPDDTGVAYDGLFIERMR